MSTDITGGIPAPWWIGEEKMGGAVEVLGMDPDRPDWVVLVCMCEARADAETIVRLVNASLGDRPRAENVRAA